MVSQKNIESKVLKYIREKKLFSPGEKVCVALSGGEDSVCLLEILLDLRDQLQIEIGACHYNHRLRGKESDLDAEFVKDLCAKKGIKCLVGESPKKNNFKNENDAREARYSFFEKVLAGEGYQKIALAHHLNDSAETVVLRTVRGTGFRGLKSIPAVRSKFCRPLLQISKKEIKEFIADRKVDFRFDQTNNDSSIDRNYVRHSIIPALCKLNPNLIETLGNSAHATELDYDFVLAEARRSLKEIGMSTSIDEIILSRSKWLLLHPSIQRMTLRLAIEKLIGLDEISYKQIEEVVDLIVKGEGKKHKSLPRSLRITLESGKIILSICNKGSE